MKEKIDSEQQKKYLVEMLKYVDDICRKNSINYTLIGGSLIGVIRHKGFIPWDDDVDIGLTMDEYDKLITILKNENNPKYKLFDSDIEGYYYPYAKLVSQETIVIEKNLRTIKNYGLFIDIFRYNYTYDEDYKRNKHYKKIKFKQSFIGGYFKVKSDSVLKNIRNKISKLLGIRVILKVYETELIRCKEKTKYLISNWPQYGQDKEIMKTKFFDDFIDGTFEGINVMITKYYDEMLKIAFGNYMKLPPKSERKSHNLEVYKK